MIQTQFVGGLGRDISEEAWNLATLGCGYQETFEGVVTNLAIGNDVMRTPVKYQIYAESLENALTMAETCSGKQRYLDKAKQIGQRMGVFS